MEVYYLKKKVAVKFSNYDTIENLLHSINDFCKLKSPPIPSIWTYNKTYQTINVQLTNPLIIEFIDCLNEGKVKIRIF